MTRAVRRRRLVLAPVLVTAGVLATGAVTALAATPSPSAAPTADPAERPEEQAERKAAQAERKAAQAERRAARGATAAGPAFVCHPALDHGENVSAYARSLPKGPGRGRLVSQAARSDCGKPSPADD